MPINRKSFGKFADRFLPDAVLHMEIMLSHIHIGVAYDALNGREIHAKCLHLTNISMTTGVRSQQTYSFYLRESFPKVIPEIGGITRGVLLAFLPDEFRIDLTKLLAHRRRLGGTGISR